MEPRSSPANAPAPHAERLTLDELTAVALGADARRMNPVQLYLGVKGRIPRSTYWLHGVLSLLLAGVVLDGLLAIARVEPDTANGLVSLLLLWPLIAVSAKRQHDFDFSAWWALIHFVPAVGSIVLLLVDGLMPGTHGPNRFGPDPRRPRAAAPLNSGH
ncbi:MAG: DUF805 domain-containing protein [Burkholderiales bacterium]|nr:DUF805 domain-containing protein [Burkholderiales bacterium]